MTRLTPRETEILGLLMDGLSRQEIARRLFLSGETIKSHVGSLRKKLGIPGSTGVREAAFIDRLRNIHLLTLPHVLDGPQEIAERIQKIRELSRI